MIPQCQIIHLALHRKGHLWNPIAPHSSRRGHIGIDRSGLSHLLAQSRIKLEIVSHRPHQSVVSRRNWNSSPRSQAASSAVPETKPHSLSRSGRSFTAAR